MKYYLLAALLFSFSAHGEIVKWVDAAGKVHYSDGPPPSDVPVKKLNIPSDNVPVHTFSGSGFQGIKWGIDEAGIISILGNQVKRLPTKETFNNAYANLSIPKYLVGGVLMKVFFQMDNETKLLNRVLMQKISMGAQQPAFASDFDALSTQLTAKYGTGSRSGAFKQQWVNGDTLIQLDYLYQPGILENLTVLYRSR
ncbi:MAG: DUF4124 domain-containing protein [Gallionella sp.]|nr:DUF4124 domain-containing protein [Gallionella sp.]